MSNTEQVVVKIEDKELLSRLEAEAERRGKSLPEVIVEALDWWMQALEVAGDIADSEAALEEYHQEGGIDAFEYFRQRERDGALQS